MVSGQNCFLELRAVAEQSGVLATAFVAGIAEVFLLTGAGHAIAPAPFTAAMTTEDNLRNYAPAYTVLSTLDYYQKQ